MITETLKGADKYTAITQMRIAEAITRQPDNEIGLYVSHGINGTESSLVVMARRIPYHVDAWRVQGPVKERISRVNALTRDIQTAYANMREASNTQ